MKIERLWSKDLSEQGVNSWCGGRWAIDDLIEKTKHLKVFDLNLDHIDLSNMSFDCKDIVDFCRHIKHVNEASLDYSIILDSKGCILDGRHRICKALMLGHKKIKAVRMKEYIKPTQLEQ